MTLVTSSKANKCSLKRTHVSVIAANSNISKSTIEIMNPCTTGSLAHERISDEDVIRQPEDEVE